MWDGAYSACPLCRAVPVHPGSPAVWPHLQAAAWHSLEEISVCRDSDVPDWRRGSTGTAGKGGYLPAEADEDLEAALAAKELRMRVEVHSKAGRIVAAGTRQQLLLPVVDDDLKNEDE